MYFMLEEGVEKGEPSYSIGRSVNRGSYCGEQSGGLSKNLKWSYHMTQQSFPWTYIQRKT